MADDPVKNIMDWGASEIESEWATELGEKICNRVGRLFAKVLWWMIQGFSLASGVLLAYGLYTYWAMRMML